MTGTTSSLCASHATQGYTQREVTDGMEERVIHMNDGHDSQLKNFSNYFCYDGRDSHFAKGRARSNPYGSFVRATVPPLRVYFLRI